MKLSVKHYPVTWRIVANVLIFILLLMLTEMLSAQQAVKDTVYPMSDDSMAYAKTAVVERNKPDVITSFEDLNMPPEMLSHFSQLTPESIVYFRDELQATQNSEDGVEVIITVKLRFSNNNLIGYIQEAPLEKTTQITVSKYTVIIPVEWVCTPFSKKHPQHYVSNLADIKTAEDQYKCKNWHIKLQAGQNVGLHSSKKAKNHQSA